MRRVLHTAPLVLAIALLAGCSAGNGTPVVTTEPPQASPTATEQQVDADPGTRDNPLGIGEFRKITSDSMWTVGAEGPTVAGDGYVVLPLRLGLDWEVARVKAEASGATIDGGVDPWQSLQIEFVTKDGRSFRTMDNYEANVSNELSQVGTVYPPAESVSANVAVSVPADQSEGGSWVIRNSGGDVIFIASE